jgi:predicted transcriptional regulator with HTH domain
MMEEEVRDAIISELKRQAETNPSKLKLAEDGERMTVNGEVDLAALAMAIVGTIAGGP